MKVIKRDGTEVLFDPLKIVNAIKSANKKVNEEKRLTDDEIESIAYDITSTAGTIDHSLSVENIQDMVEERLWKIGKNDVSREYVIYREKRTRIRENNSVFMKAFADKLMARNIANQNANVDEKSFGGRVGEATDVVMKWYALNNCLSEKGRINHLLNIIYTHDLSSYAVGSHNCLSVPFDTALANGVNTRQTDVRPANSIGTACQLIAVYFQLQSLNQFGGVSATHLDWTLAPYVRKSFLKNYIVEYLKSTEAIQECDLMDLLFSDYEDEDGIVRNEFDDFVDEHKHDFFEEVGLTEEDFCIGNKENLNRDFYQRALFDTIRETQQGLEGLYHNLKY